jgi:hypothetical protein
VFFSQTQGSTEEPGQIGRPFSTIHAWLETEGLICNVVVALAGWKVSAKLVLVVRLRGGGASPRCPGGEIGRRRGLKILFLETGVRVQFPPRAPCKSIRQARFVEIASIPACVCWQVDLFFEWDPADLRTKASYSRSENAAKTKM